MKTSIERKLESGRVVSGGGRPLFVRIDLEDGVPQKAAIGIERGGETVDWILGVKPTALFWLAEQLTNAQIAGEKIVEQMKGGD